MAKQGFNCNCNLDRPAISKLLSNIIKATEDTADDIKDKVIQDQVTPYASGRLQNSMKVSAAGIDKYAISYSAPYASSLYFSNRVFNTSINANASARWLDYLNTSNNTFIRQSFISNLKKRGVGQ